MRTVAEALFLLLNKSAENYQLENMHLNLLLKLLFLLLNKTENNQLKKYALKSSSKTFMFAP